MPLLVFEFFGTTEMFIIALVAMIIFGPRKLPELGRTIGKKMGEFRRVSDDFKRTWEREVEVERFASDVRIEPEVLSATTSLPDTLTTTISSPAHANDDASDDSSGAAHADATEQTIARTTTPTQAVSESATDEPEQVSAETSPERASKQEWL